MKKQKLKKGNIYLVEYLDASYSYNSSLSKEEVIPPTVISLGFLCDFNQNYINLGLITQNNKCFEGLVIPNGAILNIKLLKI